jgi:Pyruvate/2-oxoacid:ferredoxin oxidoreductase delta subunit
VNAATQARRPTIDPRACAGCRKCVAACPKGAILESLHLLCSKCVKYCMTLEVDCQREPPRVDLDRCDGCGLCLAACPDDAIHWT